MQLYELTISEARKGLEEKKFSSSELTSACLERIKSVEPKLHAFVTLTEEQALQQAQKADFLLGSGEVRPLLGIPISIKDNFCINGILTTASSNVLRNFVPPYDATVVRRVKEAGAISLGKTNMDAFAHMLEVLAGHDPLDATTSPLPTKPYRQLMKEKSEKVTIGISDDYFDGVDPEIVSAVQKALHEFERLGHKVKKINLFNPKYAIAVYTILQRSEVSSNLARYDGIRYGF